MDVSILRSGCSISIPNLSKNLLSLVGFREKQYMITLGCSIVAGRSTRLNSTLRGMSALTIPLSPASNWLKFEHAKNA